MTMRVGVTVVPSPRKLFHLERSPLVVVPVRRVKGSAEWNSHALIRIHYCYLSPLALSTAGTDLSKVTFLRRMLLEFGNNAAPE